ncbi:hypothetical protein GWK47_045901 [Chionoecetes opilio]|uniref:Uncharacterized protein n=1 Tax=Chionoecetes opilio TaxID=41210 RepID=A0A8J4YED7_CHIOP|nr:hypothetical protein GWK47_045901 [Chionoecetes opilio]
MPLKCWRPVESQARNVVYPETLRPVTNDSNNTTGRPKGYKARFLSLFDNMDFLMATAIHPLFKLSVVRLLNPEKVDAVKSRLLFEALRSPGPTATEGTNSTRLSNKMGKELESWCSEKQMSKVLEQAISAAVERLFSQGADIIKAKRASLTSANFERLIFMKGNMDLLKMELSPEDSE